MLLQLDAYNRNVGVTVSQDETDDTATTAQIQHLLPRFKPGEMGSEHRINRKSVAIPALPANQASLKQGVIGQNRERLGAIGQGVSAMKEDGGQNADGLAMRGLSCYNYTLTTNFWTV